MLLSLATGIIYFVFAVTGLSLSAGLGVLIIGVPFFLVFVAVSRVVSLAEGRLIEAMTGERMPRRPVYQGKAQAFWTRIIEMLKDRRTWTTIAYFILMLPIGIAYFVTAVVGLSVSLAFIFAPLADFLGRVGVAGFGDMHIDCAWRGGMDSGFGFRAAAADAAGSLTADLDHASGARRWPPACPVRENSAGRARSADRTGGQR